MPCLGTLLAAVVTDKGLRPGPDLTEVLAVLTTTAALTGTAL
jgi:hypothetical protein